MDDDPFQKKLLTDGGKWWEFFSDADIEEQKTDYSNQLDWSKARTLERKKGPLELGFFHRCSECGRPLPPDLTFCVYCGSLPRTEIPEMFIIVVSGSEDALSIREAALWLSQSIPRTDQNEISSILSDLPASFRILAAKDQVSTLCARMNDVGIYATAHPEDRDPTNWVRETAESATRHPVKIALALLLAGLLIWIIFFHLFWIIFWFALAAGLGYLELGWYQDKYLVNINVALNYASGFDEHLVKDSVHLFKSLRDNEVKEYFSVFLMEYYSLSQNFRSEQKIYGDVLENARSHLRQLLEDVILMAEKYVGLEKLKHPQVFKRQRQELKHGDEHSLASQKLELDKQIQSATLNLQVMEKMKQQMHMMTIKLESLRNRFTQIRNKHLQRDEICLEDIIGELDLELGITEDVIHSLEKG